MNSLEIQEKTLYTHLQPFLSGQGYEIVKPGTIPAAATAPELPTPLKEFRKITSGGFKSVMFSFGNNEGEQVLNIHLGVRFNMVETLVSQFMKEEKLPAGPHTIIASLHRFNRPPLPRLLLTDEKSLHLACKQIGEFMQKKGFRFLNTFDKLKRADASLNRMPYLPSPYVPSQIHRCFKGITLARLLQRTNFEALSTTYQNYLQSQKASEGVIQNYVKLVTYLKCFSFN